MTVPYNFLIFLDRCGLYFLSENHGLPAYGYRKENAQKKAVEKTAITSPKNDRKIRPGFQVDTTEESKGQVNTAWEQSVSSADAYLTEQEKQLLVNGGFSLEVAAVIKEEKVLNNLSNSKISAKYHTKGQRTGFGISTVEKIARIVCPSPVGGRNSKSTPNAPK